MKLTLLIKRICLISFFTSLAVLLLFIFILNSPLVDLGLEFLLESLTAQKVSIGSARLRLFPQVRIEAKELSLKDHETNIPVFTAEWLVAEADIFKLRKKEIDITRLEAKGFKLLLISDQDAGYNFIPPFLVAKYSNDETERDTEDPSKWKFLALSLVMRGGLISYVERETNRKEQPQALKNVHGGLVITPKDLRQISLSFAFQKSITTISGSVINYLTEEPECSLQVKSGAPFSMLKEYVSEQLGNLAGDKSCEMSVSLKGTLSQLGIHSELAISPSSGSFSDPYFPTHLALAALFKDREHLKVESLKLHAPSAKISAEGTVYHLLSPERMFDIRYESHVLLNALSHRYHQDLTLKGEAVFHGMVKGGMDSFDVSAKCDLSDTSVTLPGLVTINRRDLRSVTVTGAKRADALEFASQINDCFNSDVTLNGKISNVFGESREFRADLKGTHYYPALIKSFPFLKGGDFTIPEDVYVHIVGGGTFNHEMSLKLEKGVIKALDSELLLAGELHNVLSPERSFALDSQISLDAKQLSCHFPHAIGEGWQIRTLPPINVSLKGSLDDLSVNADLSLKDLDLSSPYFSLEKPHERGRVTLKASLINKKDIAIEDLTVRFGKSRITLHGKVIPDTPEGPEYHIETEGNLHAEEVLPIFPEIVPDNVLLEGSLHLQASFTGNPTRAFKSKALVDLTKTSWEDPYLIKKKEGVENRVTFNLQRDHTTGDLEGAGGITLERAHMDFAFSGSSGDGKLWLVELNTTPIELSMLESFKLHHDGGYYEGRVDVDVRASVNFENLPESSVEGYINIDNVLVPVEDQKITLDAKLNARGEVIEIPYFTLRYGSSDFELKEGVFSWNEFPRLEGTLTSQSFCLGDFIAAVDDELLDQKPADEDHDEIMEDEQTEEESQKATGKMLWWILEQTPYIAIDCMISNFFVGDQQTQDVSLKFDGAGGTYSVHFVFPTAQGEIDVEAEIIAPFDGRYVKEVLIFDIYKFNMTELTRLLELG
jgi:hypothetical protein